MGLSRYIVDETIWFLNIVGLIRFGIWLILKYIPSFMYNSYGNNITVSNLTLTPDDVTIVVPVFHPDIPNVMDACLTWQSNNVKRIILIANLDCYQELQLQYHNDNIVEVVQFDQEELIESGNPSKRCALIHGLKLVDTKIVVFADDDVFWTTKLVSECLKPFNNDPLVVACGPMQRVKPKGNKFTIAEIMADMRLFTRFIEIKATTKICNYMLCVSGRTAFYRTSLLKNSEFESFFLRDRFGDFIQNSGDDKCIARWIYPKNNQYFAAQINSKSLMTTEFPEWKKFSKQIIRWGRNTWKSDLKTVTRCSLWKNAHWLCIIMVDRMIAPFFLLGGHIAGYIVMVQYFDYKVLLTWIAWIFLTRFIKLFGYFWDKPCNIVYLPIYILFTYYTSILKIYSLITLSKKPNWLTR